MATQSLSSTYFNKFAHHGEQNLIADLVTESIAIYGIDVGYMAKKYTSEGYDQLYNEEDLAVFDNVTDVVMYIRSVDGFEGEGDFLSKFGLEIRDQMTLSVAVRAFENEVQATQNISRPREGDLIFFPLNEKVYQIQFAEHEPTFYQMGALQFYDLRCELFEYSNERFNTGIDAIDELQTKHSLDILDEVQLLSEDGITPLFTEDGYRLTSEEETAEDDSAIASRDFDTITDSESVFIETEADAIIDFSEADPFSDGGRF